MSADLYLEQLKDSITYLSSRVKSEKDDNERKKLSEELTQAKEKMEEIQILKE